MSNRKIPAETKVEVMEKCLCLVDVEEVADRHGVSVGAVYYWFNQKTRSALVALLVNETPVPKPEPGLTEEVSEPTPEDRPTVCDECGGMRIWKNSTMK